MYRPVPSSRTSYPLLTFRPAWWLPNAHLQTLWGPLVRRPPQMETRFERWIMPDGDFLRVERLDAAPGAPRLVVLHGLEGSSSSPYVRGVLAGARAQGWGANVIVFRGCGGEMNDARRFYHSGETTDLDEVVRRIRAEDPEAPLLLAGFSLGGNVLLKWLGEQGSAGAVAGAVAVSVPYDLERGARYINRGFARVYERNFLKSLREKAIAKRARFPDLPSEQEVRGARTIYDFDDRVTAPLHGFRDARDYYSRSSSLGFLPRIRARSLLLSAADDPFLPREVLVEVAALARANDALELEIVPCGGHVGFVEGPVPWRASYYAERRVIEFLASSLDAFRQDARADTFIRPPTKETSHA